MITYFAGNCANNEKRCRFMHDKLPRRLVSFFYTYGEFNLDSITFELLKDPNERLFLSRGRKGKQETP
jgi:hypothetical protein